MEEKQKIRARILFNLRKQRGEERKQKSERIKEKLFLLPEFNTAKTVMFYISTPEEVDTRSIIKEALERGKRVVVPITNVKEVKLEASNLLNSDKDLVQGAYGIYEPGASCKRPISLEEIDMIVVPGVAFDIEGNRLGRGKGYYDRFLKELPGNIPVIGLAFNFQLLENLPHAFHDIPVTRVLAA